jgi:hypothetical protein
MKKKFSDKDNWQKLQECKIRYLEQKKFPPLPMPYESRVQPIKHTGYLMFIRSKFIYLAFIESLEKKNLYAAYSLLKSYWEDLATFGFYYIKISRLLEANDEQKAFELSRKMALGGRGFLTEEMVLKKGREMKDFQIPRISEMIRTVDADLKRNLKTEDSILGDMYHQQVAEGGHTTYIGLWIAGKRKVDGSGIADINRSWNREENSSILNLGVMAAILFFHYWSKFDELKTPRT